jgi:hypothetical protein
VKLANLLVNVTDPTLTALAGVTTAADKVIYATAADTFTTSTLTTFGRSLIDDADAATARTTLGLGNMSTQVASNVAITGGSISGVTGLTATGTAFTPAGSIAATNVQSALAELDGDLTAIPTLAAAGYIEALAVVGGVQTIQLTTEALTWLLPQWIVRSSNTAAVNNTTLVTTGLTLTLAANATYAFVATVAYDTDQTADFRFNFTLPASATGYFTTTISAHTTNTGTSTLNATRTPFYTALPAGTDTQIGGFAAGTPVAVVIRGHVVVTTSGTFDIKFAQATTQAGINTTVSAGSSLEMRRVA